MAMPAIRPSTTAMLVMVSAKDISPRWNPNSVSSGRTKVPKANTVNMA
jgi:hypothetical protein